MSALPGDLSYKISQLLDGNGCSGVFGCAEFGGGGVLRQDDLHYEQLCTIAFSELSGPQDGPIGRFWTVGAHHNTPNGAILRLSIHNRFEPHRWRLQVEYGYYHNRKSIVRRRSEPWPDQQPYRLKAVSKTIRWRLIKRVRMILHPWPSVTNKDRRISPCSPF